MCECLGAAACPDGAANGTCVTQPGGYCFVAVEEVLDDNGLVVVDRSAGCLPPDESGFMQVSILLTLLIDIQSVLKIITWILYLFSYVTSSLVFWTVF